MTDNSKPAQRVNAQLPATGLAGQNGVYVILPLFPPNDPKNEGGPAGLPGEYEVTFTLNRPGYPLQAERSVASGDQLEGDSHLEIPGALRINADVEGNTITFEG